MSFGPIQRFWIYINAGMKKRKTRKKRHRIIPKSNTEMNGSISKKGRSDFGATESINLKIVSLLMKP